MQLLTQYKDQVQVALTEDILPFHMRITLDKEQGGFHGRILNDLTVDRGAPKGLVQHKYLPNEWEATFPASLSRLLALHSRSAI
jgi:hypothetical protein